MIPIICLHFGVDFPLCAVYTSATTLGWLCICKLDALSFSIAQLLLQFIVDLCWSLQMIRHPEENKYLWKWKVSTFFENVWQQFLNVVIMYSKPHITCFMESACTFSMLLRSLWIEHCQLGVQYFTQT